MWQGAKTAKKGLRSRLLAAWTYSTDTDGAVVHTTYICLAVIGLTSIFSFTQKLLHIGEHLLLVFTVINQWLSLFRHKNNILYTTNNGPPYQILYLMFWFWELNKERQWIFEGSKNKQNSGGGRVVKVVCYNSSWAI